MTVELRIADADFRLYVGDVLDGLAGLRDESIHMVVSSPPYWGLRDYGTGQWDGGDQDCDHVVKTRRSYSADGLAAWSAEHARGGGHAPVEARVQQYADLCGKCGATRIDRQLGLEPVPDCAGWATGEPCGTCYVCRMVAVFREVRRVLRSDGTCWLNIGDSYTSGGRGSYDPALVSRTSGVRNASSTVGSRRPPTPAGLKPKDMVMIPQRLALALQADGWYVRCDVIWAKPDPMPESATDRPTKSHEYVWLLSKRPRYYYDRLAVLEPFSDKLGGRQRAALRGDTRYVGAEYHADATDDGRVGRLQGAEARTAAVPQVETLDGSAGERPRGADGRRQTHVEAGDGSLQHRDGERWPHPEGRNARSVWIIGTEAYKEAHFATFPRELARKCILAGTSEHGVCPTCGAPWQRQLEKREYGDWGRKSDYVASKADGLVGDAYYDQYEPPRTVGWEPTCKCYAHGKDYKPVPAVVLDPFMGSGTVAEVARKLGRHSVGIELSDEYADLIAKRTRQLGLLV